MLRRHLFLSVLALCGACTDDPPLTASEAAATAATCGANAGELTSNDSSLSLGGDLLAGVACSNYDDPRIGGSDAELAAFLADSCTVTLGSIPHAGECDTNQPPVIIDETADTLTIARCVNACDGTPYTAEGGVWADVPDGSPVFDVSCETSGPYAGCCDFFDVLPAQLGSCDRGFTWDGGSYVQTAGGSPAPLGASTTLARRAPTGGVTHVAPGLSFRADPVGPPSPPDNRRAELMRRIRNLIAGIIFGGWPSGTEIGEQLQKIAEQARDLAENKGQQRLEIQTMPRPVARGPLDPSPPKKGIIVMPGGRPGPRPIDRPPTVPDRPPGTPPTTPRPPPEPPKPPRLPGG